MDTILIVDDEPDLREGLRAVLEAENFRVVACADGHEARLRVFEDPPDLIVSDIRMPGMDGWELVRELHELPLTRHTPFLFLTGHADRDTFAEALRSGVDGVLMKPVHPAKLVDAIRARLDRARSISEEATAANDLFRTTLARALPHGLNTAMHIIGGYATLLASHIPPTDEEGLSYVAKIQDSTRRLKSNLEKLWLLLTIEEAYAAKLAGSMRPAGASTPLRPTVQSVADAMAQALRRPVVVEDSVPDAVVRIEETQLRDLVAELVENALVFSDRESSLTISGSLDESTATLTIVDHGRAMGTLTIDGLEHFEAFQRERFERRGHGLGLTIVSRLLRLNDGNIHILSKSGTGTTVSVSLPLRRV